MLDFKAIAARLLADAPRHLGQWLPQGKLHGREYVVGNLRGEAGDSLSINIDRGVWKDFASQTGGADLISLYAAINGIKQGEAAKQFATDKDKMEDDKYFPGPASGPIPAHSKYGEVKHVAEYRRADGNVVGYVCRFEPPNERKQCIPRSCYIRPNGTIYWKWKKWEGLSPLYRLGPLVHNPADKVLIVEGEKKAERAQALMPADWMVIAWCGGVEAVKGTDWNPLAGRDVWIWPDNDEPGRAAAAKIKGLVPGARIAKVPGDLPVGWDLGDAADGFDVISNLKEDVNAIAIQQMTKNSGLSLDERLDKINGEYAVILRGGQVLIMRYWKGEDGNSQLTFLSDRHFLLLQENNIVYIEKDDGKVSPLKVGKSWLEWEGRQEFEAVYFEPAGPKYQMRYNLWQGFAVEPRAEGKFDLFLAHIRDNICQGNKEQYDWVMAWLADLVQKPNRKLGTALVLRGPMGIGKGVFANHIGHLLGRHYMTITQSGQLTGKFNGHMADKLLMFVDEGWWSDERYGEGVLRGLITEHQVTIEMKGRDAVTLQNYTRFIIAANADWVVPLGMGDERRFVILDVGTANQRDTKYFKAIDAQMHNGGYNGLLAFLMAYRYDEALPRSVIKTAALAENKLYSMPDELQWWHECLIGEKIGKFKIRTEPNNDIEVDKFYEHYKEWCQETNRRILTKHILAKKLRPVIVNLNKARKITEMGGEREYFYELQSLGDMRRYFEQYIGHPIDWENE